MIVPTAAELRADTRIDWVGTFNMPAPIPPAEDLLTEEIALAWLSLESLTGRDMDTADPSLDPAIRRAVLYMVLYQAASARNDFSSLTAAAAGGIITSFTVPGYSETRQVTSQSSRSSGGARGWIFIDWEPLDRLIWLLATVEKRDEMVAIANGWRQPFMGIAYDNAYVIPSDPFDA